MYKFKKKRKAIMFSLGLAIAMLLTPSVQAQGILGDLLDEYYAEQDQQRNDGGGVMGRGLSNSYNLNFQDFGSTEVNINAEDFGSPVGNGVLILLATGVGYATMKKKNTNNIKNERKETKS